MPDFKGKLSLSGLEREWPAVERERNGSETAVHGRQPGSMPFHFRFMPDRFRSIAEPGAAHFVPLSFQAVKNAVLTIFRSTFCVQGGGTWNGNGNGNGCPLLLRRQPGKQAVEVGFGNAEAEGGGHEAEG